MTELRRVTILVTIALREHPDPIVQQLAAELKRALDAPERTAGDERAVVLENIDREINDQHGRPAALMALRRLRCRITHGDDE